MVYKTLIINKHGADLHLASPVENFPLNISKNGVLEHVTDDPFNLFSRYSEIIFKPGIKTTKQMESSNVATISLAMSGLKLKVRKNWTEPKRKFPVCTFLNLGGSPLEILSIDCFNWNDKVYLMRNLPVIKEVPIYSVFAEYKQYIIKEPVFQAKTGPGYLPGAGHFIPQYVLEDKRKGDDMKRVKQLLREWGEEEKNRVKVTL